jgi:hypothetical protein
MSPSRLFTYAAVVILLLCPVTFFAGMFAPRTLSFLDSVICPAGYELGSKTEPAIDSEGDQVMRTTTICTNSSGQSEDATPKMLAILFALPIVAVGVYFLGNRITPAKT